MKVPQARFSLKEPKSKTASLIYLYYRLPNHSKRVVFSTQEYCHPKFWDNKARRVKNSIAFQKGRAINRVLNNYALMAENLFMEYKGEIDEEEFKLELEYRSGRKGRVVLEEDKPMTLYRYIDEYIANERDKPNSEYGTWKKYLTVFNHIKSYGKAIKAEVDFDMIDWKFRDEFQNWLYDEPRSHSANNVSKIFEVLKKFLKLSFRDKHHTNTIFQESDFGVKRVKVRTKIRLTPDEVEKVMETDFSDSPHYERVRDMFVAACYSGLRISDWKHINKNHIINYSKIQVLKLMMKKTKKPVSIPMMSELTSVIKKYDYNLPTIEPQPFNRSLKEVLKKAIPDSTFLRIYSKGGVTKSETVPKWKFASSHAGRRTFASNRYLEGWSLRKIMNILGHASEKQTEEYMDISDWELTERDVRVVEMIEYMKEKKRKEGGGSK